MDEITKLFELRKWEAENLPLCKNTVGYAVFECVANSVILGAYPTIKELVNSLPRFSRAGIYLQLKQLESDAWITYSNGASDARNKHIIPTERLLSLIQQYASRARQILKFD